MTSDDHPKQPDYETMARDMMQQWQDSWKTMLKDGPVAGATTAAANPANAAEDSVKSAQDAWGTFMQPMMSATQQFWQQVLTPAATTDSEKEAPDASDARFNANGAAAAERAGTTPAAAPAAPAAAAPHAGADAHAELARRIDLLSQRLLRVEVELDKLKRGATS